MLDSHDLTSAGIEPLHGHEALLESAHSPRGGIGRYAEQAGLNMADFSGHSLRSGFVPSAADRNADLNRIMDQTRHRDPRIVRAISPR